MNRISVAEAAHDFRGVLRRVTACGESLELEDSGGAVAWLIPPGAARECSVADLERLLSSLPTLGDDLESFASDMESAKSALVLEGSRWE